LKTLSIQHFKSFSEQKATSSTQGFQERYDGKCCVCKNLLWNYWWYSI